MRRSLHSPILLGTYLFFWDFLPDPTTGTANAELNDRFCSCHNESGLFWWGGFIVRTPMSYD
jgi:hypothetical protein